MENSLELPIALEQRIADLIVELKADLYCAPNLNFEFDEEYQQMFLENAKGLAPFIPGIIHDYEISLEENALKSRSLLETKKILPE